MKQKEKKQILQILEQYIVQMPNPDSQWPYDMQRAVRFICKNLFDNELTVSKLKEHCRNKNNNFSTIFGFYVGETPKSYINNHRLNAAKQILSITKYDNISIFIIAKLVGFSGKGAFNHAFRKSEKLSPEVWRNRRNKLSRNQVISQSSRISFL